MTGVLLWLVLSYQVCEICVCLRTAECPQAAFSSAKALPGKLSLLLLIDDKYKANISFNICIFAVTPKMDRPAYFVTWPGGVGEGQKQKPRFTAFANFDTKHLIWVNHLPLKVTTPWMKLREIGKVWWIMLDKHTDVNDMVKKLENIIKSVNDHRYVYNDQCFIYIYDQKFISSVSCSILHPNRTPSNPLLAYAVTSVSDGVLHCIVLQEHYHHCHRHHHNDQNHTIACLI